MKKASLLPLLLCLSLAYSQESLVYMLQSPGDAWLAASINPVSGNFSAYNLKESDPDFVPLLFGGAAMSSHIAYTINGTSVHQSNLRVNIALGPTAGGQIDGSFETNGVHIETAYFLMNADTDASIKTLGIAVLVSNTLSNQSRRVGVKILLDTEIGDTQNKALLYLPSGRQLDVPHRFGARSIPEYIFVGERDSFAGLAEGKGFYIYPYLSTNFPAALVTENWGRLASSAWEPRALSPAYLGKSGSIDAGLGIYYGEYTLGAGQEITLGAALSLNKIVTVPVLKDGTRAILEDSALSRGVFAPERYLINELLVNPSNEALQGIFFQKNLPQPIPGRGMFTPAFSEEARPEAVYDPEEILWDQRAAEPLNRQLLKMEGTMDQLRRIYEENMGLDVKPSYYIHPPYNGISERNYVR